MVARWEPRPLTVTGDAGARSPELLEQILDALEVETEPRYRPDGPITWCNLAVWDATRALGCDVPHWHRGKELTANGMILWLRSEGVLRGWAHVSEASARLAANRGEAVVAAWLNPHGGHGHVAMVRPTPDGEPLRIWQAGARNLNSAPLAVGFGSRPVSFYSHP